MKRAAWIMVLLAGCGEAPEPTSAATVDANGGTLVVGR